jgi:hypothetical protein
MMSVPVHQHKAQLAPAATHSRRRDDAAAAQYALRPDRMAEPARDIDERKEQGRKSMPAAPSEPPMAGG